MFRTRKAALGGAVAALAALTAISLPGGAGAASNSFTIPNCTPIGNVEAIIDDSGSMSSSDFNELRRTGLEIFILAAGNARRTLGAVEFGSSANTVFPPAVIGPNRRFMINRLRAVINADNGGTDYNSGFILGALDNRGAQARIFLTDGADNGGFSNTHRNGPRTFVVGLGIGRPSPTNPDANRLQQIANETGGIYFPDVTAARLQPTFNAISSAVGCLQPPKTYRSRLFSRARQSHTRTARISTRARKFELVVNWAQPSNSFTLSNIQALGRRNRVLASLSGRGRPKKLRIRRGKGDTFRSYAIRKPRGTRKLRFKVRAKRVITAERTITQLTQRR